MYRILIADDEPIERAVVAKMLQKNFEGQLEVISAVNGREAVKFYKEQACKIALLDIEMPGVNGLEAAEQIREMDEDAVIIFLTAFDEFNYAKRAISVHALEYLLKPTSEEELVSTIDEALFMLGAKKIVKQSAVDDDSIKHSDNVKLNAVADSICEYIKQHYQEDISLQDVAGYLSYSDAYFCRIFKQCFDRSFLAYLTEYRVERAKELLEDFSVNIKDVSYRVGYRDSNYFAKVFKRIAGVTPTEYRVQTLQNASRQEIKMNE